MKQLVLIAMCGSTLIFSIQASANDAKSESTEQAEHTEMALEHTESLSDHQKWESQLRLMRAEHKSALATLRRLEAEILEHEA